jgi:hypothetical protein
MRVGGALRCAYARCAAALPQTFRSDARRFRERRGRVNAGAATVGDLWTLRGTCNRLSGCAWRRTRVRFDPAGTVSRVFAFSGADAKTPLLGL